MKKYLYLFILAADFKRLLLIAGILFSGGCAKEVIKVVTQEEADKINKKTLVDYRFVDIDGCEYLEFSTTHGFRIVTHKGNCKYCTERNLNHNK